jgi:hypothetical protein
MQTMTNQIFSYPVSNDRLNASNTISFLFLNVQSNLFKGLLISIITS